MSDPLAPVAAPTRALDVARQLGPALIITAVIVGSGELIVTPKLGASAGFQLLWFIVLGCLLKVFVQVELGRHAVAHGTTTLAALDTLPGPRFRVSWVLWLWLLMYVSLVFQVAGMVGGLASIFSLGGLALPIPAIAVLVGASCAILLLWGRYRFVEAVSTLLVAAFTVTTVIAVVALQTTPYAVTAAQLADGFRFRLPDSFNTAFAAFGVIGVGASELIYYPYWCLEKGYARRVGPNDGSPGWKERARGWLRVMKVDAALSFVLYTDGDARLLRARSGDPPRQGPRGRGPEHDRDAVPHVPRDVRTVELLGLPRGGVRRPLLDRLRGHRLQRPPLRGRADGLRPAPLRQPGGKGAHGPRRPRSCCPSPSPPSSSSSATRSRSSSWGRWARA